MGDSLIGVEFSVGRHEFFPTRPRTVVGGLGGDVVNAKLLVNVFGFAGLDNEMDGDSTFTADLSSRQLRISATDNYAAYCAVGDAVVDFKAAVSERPHQRQEQLEAKAHSFCQDVTGAGRASRQRYPTPIT